MTTSTFRFCDDGIGGADLGKGSGLIGLKDRAEALGGRMTIMSPAGGGISSRPRSSRDRVSRLAQCTDTAGKALSGPAVRTENSNLDAAEIN